LSFIIYNHNKKLPDHASQGATEQGAIQYIQDAIKEYLDAADELFPNGEVRELEAAV
jgi:predicted RNase H-like HicB family nuclease